MEIFLCDNSGESLNQSEMREAMAASLSGRDAKSAHHTAGFYALPFECRLYQQRI